MFKVEVIDENDNIIEYKKVNLYSRKDNLIYIDELIMSDSGIKEIRLDNETIFKKSKLKCKICNKTYIEFEVNGTFMYDFTCIRCKNKNTGIIISQNERINHFY